MSEVTFNDLESWPTDVARRLDHLCNQFEQAWQGNSRPQIEAFLTQTAQAERSALLRELLLLDLYHRRRRGEICKVTDYLPRFPQLEASWLAEAVEAPIADDTEKPLANNQPTPNARGPISATH